MIGRDTGSIRCRGGGFLKWQKVWDCIFQAWHLYTGIVPGDRRCKVDRLI